MADQFLYYLEVEEWGQFYADIEIDYQVWPGEKMVRYTANGDGYPGSPPDVEIIGARVTHLEDDKHLYFNDLQGRKNLGDWVKDLDRLALDYVLKRERELYDTLLENADACSER